MRTVFFCFFALYGVKGDALIELTALQADFFEWHTAAFPEWSTLIGEKRFSDRIDDLSNQVFDKHLASVKQFTDRTLAIKRSELSRRQRYSYDVLLNILTTFTTNYQWREYTSLNPIHNMEGFYLYPNNMFSGLKFETLKDYENYLQRLLARPSQVDQMIERMEKSIQLSTTRHFIEVRAVPEQIAQMISVPPVQNTMFTPFNATLDNLPFTQTQKDSLRSRAEEAIEGIYQALEKLKAFMTNVYMNHTRATLGVYGLPHGREFYSACLKWHLSVDLSPAEVHEIGLSEVERITRNIEKVMKEQGFTGNMTQYFKMLKADRRFYKSSAEELLAAYEDITFNRIYPKLPMLFKNVPDSPVVIEASPADGPPAMYMPGSPDGFRPGTFYINLFRPNSTSTMSIAAISLHEGVPGHHFQYISQVAADLPSFQKLMRITYYPVPYLFPFYTAYTEGWGLYSEYLGEELGVYENNYELIGRYEIEMLRACRLVLDTGLHYYGWTRRRAIDYLSSRTQLDTAVIEKEVDRYIILPGQACAYKIGELKIKELRHRASDALGADFDLSDFHSLLLTSGPMPVSLMDTMVSDFLTDHIGGKTVRSGGTGGQRALYDLSTALFLEVICFFVYRHVQQCLM